MGAFLFSYMFMPYIQVPLVLAVQLIVMKKLTEKFNLKYLLINDLVFLLFVFLLSMIVETIEIEKPIYMFYEDMIFKESMRFLLLTSFIYILSGVLSYLIGYFVGKVQKKKQSNRGKIIVMITTSLFSIFALPFCLIMF